MGWCGQPFSLGWRGSVWRLWPGEARHSVRTLPASLLLPSVILPYVLPLPSSLSSLFPDPALSPIHCQEGPCLKGPVSVSWQRQRLAAPAPSTVSLDFVSGAKGLGRAPQTDSLQALERNVHGLGRVPPLSRLPPSGHHVTSMEVSCQSHRCAWHVSRGESMVGPWSANRRRAAGGHVAAKASVRARVWRGCGCAWTVVRLLSCISGV